MNLIEVMALSGEMTTNSYANNIRLIRGNLSNPNVQVINLSTIEGMKKGNLTVQANDIIYIEPKRALFSQVLSQNVAPYLNVITGLTSVVLLYLNLR